MLASYRGLTTGRLAAGDEGKQMVPSVDVDVRLPAMSEHVYV